MAIYSPLSATGVCIQRLVVHAMLVVMLSGCSLWSGSSQKPIPAELGANVAVLGVKQVWSARIGPSVGAPLEAYSSGNVVTIATTEGVVASIDARTGNDIWRTSVGESLSAGVGSDGKSVALVTRTNALVLLNSGRELWRQTLSSQVFTAPLVAGGRVFVLLSDRSLNAFDAATGRRLWSQQRQGDPLVLRQAGVLTSSGDTLIAGLSGRIAGINPDTGSVRWEALIATSRGTNDVERLVELVGRTSRFEDSVCSRAFQSAVGCVNTTRGVTSWTQAASGIEGVHGDDQVIFGSESNGSVVAWRRSDGVRLWANDRLKHRKLTAPLLLGRSVVVGDDFGLVHLLSRVDGSPLNRISTDASGVAIAPVLAADTLVVVTRSGGVYGFRPD